MDDTRAGEANATLEVSNMMRSPLNKGKLPKLGFL
jgi:hypothetical protein